RLPGLLDGVPRLQPVARRGRHAADLARPGRAHAVGLMRYYLIDKVTELTAGQSARGVKCVTLTDEVVHDHFPDFPMLPGALIVEAAAQLAGFLLEMTFNRPGDPVVR